MNKTLFIAALVLASVGASAQQKVDLFPRDTRTYAEKEQARSQAEAKKGYEEVQRRERAEAMRDKTHDNRIKVGKDLSVGADPVQRTVNVRTTTK